MPGCGSQRLLRFRFSASVLALSVSLSLASSPKGGALGRPGHFLLDA